MAGRADAAKLSRNVAALGPKPERLVLEHGAAVAQLLLSLGVPRATLLSKCPVLFSWPANERAALLFGQLTQLGLTAVEVARCFEQIPAAAKARSFEPTIPVLAALFAAGSKQAAAGAGSSCWAPCCVSSRRLYNCCACSEPPCSRELANLRIGMGRTGSGRTSRR